MSLSTSSIRCCIAAIALLSHSIINASAFLLQEDTTLSTLVSRSLHRRSGGSSLSKSPVGPARRTQNSDLTRDRSSTFSRSRSVPGKSPLKAQELNRSKSLPSGKSQLSSGGLTSNLFAADTLISHAISRQSSLASDTRQQSRVSQDSNSSLSRSSSASWSRSPSPNREARTRPPAAGVIESIGPALSSISTSESIPHPIHTPPGYSRTAFDEGRSHVEVTGYTQGGSLLAAVGGNRVKARISTGQNGYGMINNAEPGQEQRSWIGPNSRLRLERGTIPEDRGQARLEAEVYGEGSVIAKGRN